MSDFSMLDLFRAEVATHAATLTAGLTALERNPGASEPLDALMRAAHSLKGGARIVELDAAAQLAAVLENCFGALQKGEVALRVAQIAALHQGVELLRQIAAAAGEGSAAGPQPPQTAVNQVVAAIMGIVQGVPPEAESFAPEAAAPLAELLAPPLPSQAEGPQGVAPAPRPAPDAPPAPKFAGGLADESMLELFRTEVETQTAILTEGLLALENNPGATDQLEALMRAAHSIKGAARVVEVDAAVQIAHVMEDSFVAAQKNRLTLTSDHIDILFQGVDLLRRIGELAGAAIRAWLAERQSEIQQLTTTIAAILNGDLAALLAPAWDNHPLQGGGGVGHPLLGWGGVGQPPATLPPKAVSVIVEQLPAYQTKTAAKTFIVSKPHEEKIAQISADDKDRMVRVTAAKIERLMGLGGEVVVSARWLPAFAELLASLKKTHNEVFGLLEKLQEMLGRQEDDRPARSLVLQAREKTRECSLVLADRLNQLEMFTSRSANLSDRLYHEVISVRMRPFADGVQSFPRMVRDLAKQLGKKVHLDILGKSTEVDRDILEKLDAPLTHLLRNAIDHGIETPEERRGKDKPETGLLRLEAVHRAGMLMITVADDGRGIDLPKLRDKILKKGLADAAIVENLTEAELLDFLFLPGFSTADQVTEISGRGVGLDVVHDMVHEVGGIVRAVSKPGEGLSFHLELPLTLSVIRTFLVEIAGEPYAFPLARIDHCVVLTEDDLALVEDRQYFKFDNNNIALVDIHVVLEIAEAAAHANGLPVVIISDRSNSYGLLVDKFLGEYDLVVRPLDARLGKVPDISAVAMMLDGTPVLIFDVEDMLRSVDKMLNKKRLRKIRRALPDAAARPALKRILVVDDSITVREMERKLLENRGYHVEIAVDGMDGWNAVRTENFDLVVSDIDMPRMNGIELVTKIKQHEDSKALPVIIISYKDTEAHRLQGLEAGANYYLTKSSFQDESFINAVVDLIGEAS